MIATSEQILHRPALMIVAHPDDETIWAGGLLINNRDWNWTIMSLCRGDDHDRRPKFLKVCDFYHASAIITTLNDSPELATIDPARDIGDAILRHCGETNWALCVTHGINGEYGHQRHIDIHREVRRLVDTNQLACREFWTFAYKCEQKTCVQAADADLRFGLTGGVHEAKRNIVINMYGFGSDSFEARSCLNPESFHQHRIGGKQP